MKRMERVIAKTVREFADKSVNQWTCTFFLYQPQITEQLKKRLKETR